MASHPRWNGSGSPATTQIFPRVYVLCVLSQLILLGLALLTSGRDVEGVLPGLLRAGSSLMGVGFALTLCLDRGRYCFRQHPPSRFAWVWLALSVLCTITGPRLPRR